MSVFTKTARCYDRNRYLMRLVGPLGLGVVDCMKPENLHVVAQSISNRYKSHAQRIKREEREKIRTLILVMKRLGAGVAGEVSKSSKQLRQFLLIITPVSL